MEGSSQCSNDYTGYGPNCLTHGTPPVSRGMDYIFIRRGHCGFVADTSESTFYLAHQRGEIRGPRKGWTASLYGEFMPCRLPATGEPRRPGR